MTIVTMLGGGHILRSRGLRKLAFWLTRYQVLLPNEICYNFLTNYIQIMLSVVSLITASDLPMLHLGQEWLIF
jgi:hypothetical protein